MKYFKWAFWAFALTVILWLASLLLCAQEAYGDLPPTPSAPPMTGYQPVEVTFLDGSTGIMHFPVDVIVGPSASSPAGGPPQMWVVTNTVYKVPSKVTVVLQFTDDLMATNWVDVLRYPSYETNAFFRILFQ